MTDSRLFTTCPLGCGAPLEGSGIQLREGELQRCPRCGQLLSACAVQTFERTMREFDRPEGTLPGGKSARRYHRRMGAVLRRAAARLHRHPAELSLLDVGCSSGALLRVARDVGFRAAGVEPATSAAETARAMGFEVHAGLLQEAGYPDASFDVVTLFEVIEHLLDPVDVAREIRRILRPGGLLLVGTGNADSWTVKFLGASWEYFDMELHGGHVSFYNPASIALLAERSGLDVEAIETKRVNLAERKDVPPLAYLGCKIGRELLAPLARRFGKGHDMLAILRRAERT